MLVGGTESIITLNCTVDGDRSRANATAAVDYSTVLKTSTDAQASRKSASTL